MPERWKDHLGWLTYTSKKYNTYRLDFRILYEREKERIKGLESFKILVTSFHTTSLTPLQSILYILPLVVHSLKYPLFLLVCSPLPVD